MNLIKPKEIKVSGIDKTEKLFRISRVPATEGREIFTQYASTAAPKIGNYEDNNRLMMKLMSFVEAESSGQWVKLDCKAAIDNHVTDFEMLLKIEKEMICYNTDFFSPERLSGILGQLSQTLPKRIMKILTQFAAQLSAQEKQP